MEFVDLSKYFSVEKGKIVPFSFLRKMRPILVSQDLSIIKTDENMEYVKKLVEEGNLVVPILKITEKSPYANRNEFPRRILFEMTSRCNYHCKMCPQQNLKRPRMDMDGAEYRRVIDEIDEYGVEGIWLYHLGESLLHPEFEKNINYISKKKNLGSVWMSTNGVNFTKDKIETIMRSNIKWINFSMHAVNKNTYQALIPEGDFEKVSLNLETFYAMRSNREEITSPFLHCQMIEQDVTKNEIDAFIKKHYHLADVVSVNMLEYVNLPNNSFGYNQRNRKELRSCKRVDRNDCFICSNGDVTLCDAAYNGELFLGNIHEESLYKIWNGDRRRGILELNEKGRMKEIQFCQRCTDYDL